MDLLLLHSNEAATGNMDAELNGAATARREERKRRAGGSVEGQWRAGSAAATPTKRAAERPVHTNEKRPSRRGVGDRSATGRAAERPEQAPLGWPDEMPAEWPDDLANDWPPMWPAEWPEERPEEIRAHIAYNNNNDIFIYTSSFERILDCVVNICAVFQQMADDAMRQAYPSPPPTPPSTPPPHVRGHGDTKKHKNRHRT